MYKIELPILEPFINTKRINRPFNDVFFFVFFCPCSCVCVCVGVVSSVVPLGLQLQCALKSVRNWISSSVRRTLDVVDVILHHRPRCYNISTGNRHRTRTSTHTFAEWNRRANTVKKKTKQIILCVFNQLHPTIKYEPIEGYTYLCGIGK